MPTDELECNERNVVDESKFTLDEKAGRYLVNDRL